MSLPKPATDERRTHFRVWSALLWFPEIRLPLSSRGLVGRVYHGLRLRREMSRRKHDGQARVSLAEAVRRL
jgi:hypothetical protein